jgi:hypothetical protein
VSIGRLETEADLERFIQEQVAQRLTSLQGQTAQASTSITELQATRIWVAEVNTGEVRSANTFAALTTPGPAVTVPTAGSYVCVLGAQITAGAAVTPTIGLAVNGAVAAADAWDATLGGASFRQQIQASRSKTLSAGDVLSVLYKSDGVTGVTFSLRRLLVLRLS